MKPQADEVVMGVEIALGINLWRAAESRGAKPRVAEVSTSYSNLGARFEVMLGLSLHACA